MRIGDIVQSFKDEVTDVGCWHLNIFVGKTNKFKVKAMYFETGNLYLELEGPSEKEILHVFADEFTVIGEKIVNTTRKGVTWS